MFVVQECDRFSGQYTCISTECLKPSKPKFCHADYVLCGTPDISLIAQQQNKRHRTRGTWHSSPVESYISFLRFSLGFTMVLPINFIILTCPLKVEARPRLISVT